MLKYTYLALAIWSITTISVFAQKDTLHFNAMVNFQTMLQSGNLNQYGGNLNAQLALSNKRIKMQYALSYNYVTVEEFNIIDDSWNYALFKYDHNKLLYPLVMGYHGFAKSFGIDRASVVGAGAGLNIFNRSQFTYLRVNAMLAHLWFDYDINPTIRGTGVNVFVEGNTSISKLPIHLNWEFHAYQHIEQSNVYGFQNTIRLSIPVSKKLSITISQMLVYSEQVDVDRKRFNTTSLMGLALKN